MNDAKGNLADVLLLIIKALMHEQGRKEIRLNKNSVMQAENLDIEMKRSKLTGGDLVLTLRHSPDPSQPGLLILPPNANPFVSLRNRR